jgi:phage-related tail protein
MSYDERHKAWDRFESDVQGLAGELKRHYRKADDEKNTAELNSSLEQLRQAADAVFKSLETATRDPEVREKAKQTARSFGSALAEAFRELSDEIEKAVRKPAEKK